MFSSYLPQYLYRIVQIPTVKCPFILFRCGYENIPHKFSFTTFRPNIFVIIIEITYVEVSQNCIHLLVELGFKCQLNLSVLI